jgi:hypothetical protein
MSANLTDAADAKDWEIRNENRFIASISLGHAGPKRNFGAGDRAVANLSSEGLIPLDCRRHGNAEGSCLPSSQALGADAWRGQFHLVGASDLNHRPPGPEL